LFHSRGSKVDRFAFAISPAIKKTQISAGTLVAGTHITALAN